MQDSEPMTPTLSVTSPSAKSISPSSSAPSSAPSSPLNESGKSRPFGVLSAKRASSGSYSPIQLPSTLSSRDKLEDTILGPKEGGQDTSSSLQLIKASAKRRSAGRDQYLPITIPSGVNIAE